MFLFFKADTGTMSAKSYKSLYSFIFKNISSLDRPSILFMTKMTGLFMSFSL